MNLIEFKEIGLYCPVADVYIDPWRPVDKAFITHAHADHARWGHKKYIATKKSVPVMKHRLGKTINATGVDFGETVMVNGVKFSFHPAGHIIGSAQIRVEYKGEVWVASGDYKLGIDNTCTPFETVKCNAFITESTFGLPIFKWEEQETTISEINDWWQKNKEDGKTSVITAYALGKAQRIINSVDHSIGPIFCHGAVENTNVILREQGESLADTRRVIQGVKQREFEGALVVTTPASLGTAWMKRFKNYSTAAASGWMTMRGARRRRGVDRGFVFSDHADWDQLNTAIKNTGAERIFVTHGYTSIYTEYLRTQGYDAHIVNTEYTGGEDQESEETAA